MVGLTEALLSLILVGVTIVTALLGFLTRELLFNIKPMVRTVYNYVFGAEDTDGLVDDIDEVDNRLKENARQREREHNSVETELRKLRSRTNAIVAALRRSEHVNVDVNVDNDANNDNDTKH